MNRELLEYVRKTVDEIAASPRRRRRMQEELTAHLLDALEEEKHRGPDALGRAVRRLGDVSDVRDELQASVPLVERFLFQMIYHKENIMSRWIWIVAVAALFVGPALILPALAKHRDQAAEWAAVAVPLTIGALITLAAISAIFYATVAHFRRQQA
jgi:hypothetical protein